jgi:hypothetical protein
VAQALLEREAPSASEILRDHREVALSQVPKRLFSLLKLPNIWPLALIDLAAEHEHARSFQVFRTPSD